MLSYEDCKGMCGLTDEEIESIEDAEHLPAIEACARGYSMTESPRGCRLMMKYLMDSIERSERHNDQQHANELQKDFEKFVATHHYI